MIKQSTRNVRFVVCQVSSIKNSFIFTAAVSLAVVEADSTTVIKVVRNNFSILEFERLATFHNTNGLLQSVLDL